MRPQSFQSVPPRSSSTTAVVRFDGPVLTGIIACLPSAVLRYQAAAILSQGGRTADSYKNTDVDYEIFDTPFDSFCLKMI